MKDKVVKILYAVTAFVTICLMVWEQGLCEIGVITRLHFVICFVVQALALLWCLVQCGFYDNGNDKK